MTRETKAGLLMIVMLGSVFGFMVYKRMHQPAAAMAQQNSPADSPENSETPETDSKDPFLAGAENTVETVSAIHAAPNGPARIPDDIPTARVSGDRPKIQERVARQDFAREEAREVDPFAEDASTPVAKVKPKLPTAVPDDTFRKIAMKAASAKQETTAKTIPVRPVAATKEAATAPVDSFDPFEAAEAVPNRPSKSTSVTISATENGADPFAEKAAAEEPSEPNFGPPPNDNLRRQDSSSRPTELTKENDPFATGQKVEADPFEAPVVSKSPAEIKPIALPAETASSDPFAADSQLEIQRPKTPKTLAAQIDEERKLDQATPAPRRESRIEDAFDQTPAKTEIPVLKAPSNDRTLPAARGSGNDERFGGFRAAAPIETRPNSLSNERPTIPAFSGDQSPRRTARPAPVAQIDEDFGARQSTRPLVAGDTYVIEPSENFWTISRKKYGTGRYFMALAQHNSQVITDPKRMRPGVTIATPSAEALERAYPQLIPKPAAVDPVQTASASTSFDQPTSVSKAEPVAEADAGFFVSDEGSPMYRVGQEDTLSGIAQRHLGRSSRWVQVFELNRHVLTDGNTLKIGTVLRLPADASKVDVVGTGRTFR